MKAKRNEGDREKETQLKQTLLSNAMVTCILYANLINKMKMPGKESNFIPNSNKKYLGINLMKKLNGTYNQY